MKYAENLKEYFKKETVLCIAFVLAVLSAFIVPPDEAYADYTDVRVLALLFSLMVVMAGLQKRGIFAALASALLPRAKHTGQLRLLLVFLCFFSSMLITNDVALITFVPFAIIIYTMADLREQLLYIIVLQTLAANLGSMLTPLGNPQNLYLYALSGMGISEFVLTMLPLTVLSGILLYLCCVLPKRQEVSIAQNTGLKAGRIGSEKQDRFCILFYAVLFFISLLAVLRLLPYQVPFIFAVAGALVTDRAILKKVDYSLLFTFVAFFIFIGNMGRIEPVRLLLSEILAGRELLVGFLSSQIISNVPAAVLLSGFTKEWQELLRGVNIGGLGTLIASMASLISYKLYVKEEPDKKGRYLLGFTVLNIAFAAGLLLAATVC